MTHEPGFVSSDHFDRDLYASSQAAERVLNAADSNEAIIWTLKREVASLRASLSAMADTAQLATLKMELAQLGIDEEGNSDTDENDASGQCPTP